MRMALSLAASVSSAARTVTRCARLQLPVVKVSVFCTPAAVPVSSTVTSALSLVILTVTSPLGRAARRTV